MSLAQSDKDLKNNLGLACGRSCGRAWEASLCSEPAPWMPPAELNTDSSWQLLYPNLFVPGVLVTPVIR
jgi:hypothetical protein